MNGHHDLRSFVARTEMPSFNIIRVPSICSRLGWAISDRKDDQGSAMAETILWTLVFVVMSVDCQPKARSLTATLKRVPPRTPVAKQKANKDVKIKNGQKKRSLYSGTSRFFSKISFSDGFKILGNILKKKDETNVWMMELWNRFFRVFDLKDKRISKKKVNKIKTICKMMKKAIKTVTLMGSDPW